MSESVRVTTGGVVVGVVVPLLDELLPQPDRAATVAVPAPAIKPRLDRPIRAILLSVSSTVYLPMDRARATELTKDGGFRIAGYRERDRKSSLPVVTGDFVFM